jgi:hypothetical protein
MLQIETERVLFDGKVYTRKTIRNGDGRGSERVVYLLKGHPATACRACRRLKRLAA